MATKHGVYRCENGTYDFYWLGTRMALEDFNAKTHQVAQQIFEEINGVAMGMDLSSSINEGQLALAKIEAIEGVLKLPLCTECRKLIVL